MCNVRACAGLPGAERATTCGCAKRWYVVARGIRHQSLVEGTGSRSSWVGAASLAACNLQLLQGRDRVHLPQHHGRVCCGGQGNGGAVIEILAWDVHDFGGLEVAGRV